MAPELREMLASSLPLTHRAPMPTLEGVEQGTGPTAVSLSGDEQMQLERKHADARIASRAEAAKRLKEEVVLHGGARTTLAALLTGLRLEGYQSTFDEYEYNTVDQLVALGGSQELLALCAELGVTEDDAHRIEDVVMADCHGLNRID